MFDAVLKFFLLFSVTVPNMFNRDPLQVFENKIFIFMSLTLIFIGFICIAERFASRRISGNAVFVSSLFAFIGILSCITHNFHGQVMSYTVQLALFILMTLMIVQNVRDLRSCYKFVTIGAIANVSMVIIEKTVGNPILNIPYPYIGGLMGNLPRLSLLFAIALPVVYGYSKGAAFIILIASLFCWVQPQILVFIGAMLIIIFSVKSNKTRWAILCILSAGVLLCKSKILTSFQVRFDAWIPLLKTFFSDWHYVTFGNGIGIAPVIGKNHDSMIWSSHLQFLFGAGISGLIAYGIAGIYFVKHFRPDIETVSVLNLFLIALIDYPFEVMKLWPLISFIIASYLIKSMGDPLYE